MPKHHPPELVERAQHLVETTDLPLIDIAAKLTIGIRTLGTWKREKGWTRPSAAKWRRMPARKLAAVQRIYENRGTLADIAIAAGRSAAWITKTAAAEKWTPRKESAAGRQDSARPLSAELVEIQAALRDPSLTPDDAIRHINRAATLIAADALSGDPQTERIMRILARSAVLNRSRDHHEARPDDHEGDTEPVSAEELRDELARRLEFLRDAQSRS